MANITFNGDRISTRADLPPVGVPAPEFTLVNPDLEEISLSEHEGPVVLNIFPSLDTGVCANSVRTFNERAASLDGVTVINISRDLPFAQARFCGAEGIENVIVASDFRTTFGETYGVTMIDGPLQGLLSRAVVVLDANHKIVYTEQVPEIKQEPNYDAALDALQK